VLELIPHLSRDSAATLAFILATSAEDAALRTALRSDLPRQDDPQACVHVRGTKTQKRDRLVPVISDEQWVLLDFVRQHAQGTEGRLFGPLTNFRRDLTQAAKRAKLPHVWPHALRKAAGQFLIDLHVPLELVSRVMGHVDTRVTETVYARVRDEDLGDRMLSAIDPKYARRAIDNRGTIREMETLTALPEPKAGPVLYDVNGTSRTLTQWARAQAIPKNTLYSESSSAGSPWQTQSSSAVAATASRPPGSLPTQRLPLPYPSARTQQSTQHLRKPAPRTRTPSGKSPPAAPMRSSSAMSLRPLPQLRASRVNRPIPTPTTAAHLPQTHRIGADSSDKIPTTSNTR
jgi:hypothetical protein